MPERGGREPDPRGPFVVDPERTRDRSRSTIPLVALGAMVAVVIGLTGWGILTPEPRSPMPAPPSAQPSAALGSGAPASALPDAVALARADDAVLAQLTRRAGWVDCPVWRGFGGSAEVGPGLVAAARSAQGVAAGRLEVDDLLGGTTVVWLGDDGREAARGLGGTIVVSAGDTVWTADTGGPEPPVAFRLVATAMDDGTVYWQERVRAMPAPWCVAEVAGPPARVIDVPAGADALRRLFVETGIDVCRTWQRMERPATAMDQDIDRVTDLLDVPVDGAAWVVLPLQALDGGPGVRTWVGTDPAEAGARHGSDLVVLQPGDPDAADPVTTAWMAITLDGRPAAVQFRVVETAAGRTAWLPTPNAAGIVGSCSYEGIGPGVEPGETEPDAQPGPTVELVRGGGDALPMLVEHFGWAGCRLTSSELPLEPPPLDQVDLAARAAGLGEGWLEVPGRGRDDPVFVWLGDDLVTLARANNVAVVATDGTSTAWLADSARASAWRAVATPEGRTAWFESGGMVSPDGPCLSTSVAPDTIDGVRSFTCWTDRARCLEAARNAIREAPDAFTPAMEVAAGIGEWCEPGVRCPWIGPNMPIVVTAAPVGWTSSAEVRVFSAGWRRVSMPFREVPSDEVEAAVLAMASRPSLALPVAPSGDPGAVYCPASGVTGEVRGAPWDPRVAWIGLSTVRWPQGFTARFTPSLELVSPEGAVYREGDRVQASGFAATEPVFEACRITGTLAP